MANWWDTAPVVDPPTQGGEWWQQAPMAQPIPSSSVEPATRTSRVLTGAGDLVHGGAQLLVNALPQGAVDAVNNATGWVNQQPVIGPVTRALGMTPSTSQQINQNVQQREVDYQESLRQAGLNPENADWYRVGGQIAATLPAAAAGPAAASLRGAIGLGMAQGAAINSLQPVTDPDANFWTEKARQVAIGGLTGGAGGAVSYGLGRLVSGSQSASPQVRALHDAGVEMTPGQIAGGTARRIEDSSASFPLVGSQIREAQRASVESFNRSVANSVLRPLRQRIDNTAEVGRGLIDDVYTRISAAYDYVLPRVQPFGADAQLAQDISNVSQQFLTPTARREFSSFLRDNVISRFDNTGRMNGETWKRVDETLGRFIREYRGAADPAQREMGQAAQGVQQAFRGLLERANPNEAPQIRAANEAFARFIRMERASGAQGAADGVFTPAQFSNAVRMSDRSARRGQYARGDALMQDLADAGRSVLPATVPDSGTPERLMLAQLLSGGGLGAATAAATGGMGAMPVAAGIAGATAYSGPMRRMYQALLLAQRPDALEMAGRALAPIGSPVAVPLGGLFLSPPERLQ